MALLTGAWLDNATVTLPVQAPSHRYPCPNGNHVSILRRGGYLQG